MFLVEDLFLANKVSLRVRLYIEKTDNSYDKIAKLDVLAQQGKICQRIYDYQVYGCTEFIDVGFSQR